MIGRRLARLARMDSVEMAWRLRAAARTAGDRLRTRLFAPAWSRVDLLPALARADELAVVRAALARRDWLGAHRELTRHFAEAPQRFTISPRARPELVARIRGEFPDAAREAADRADRILAGEYDVLGYKGLRFDSLRHPEHLPDWHFDPVHGRRAPRMFWSSVPYLDPACGDHKIIWEPNRHQHWLALGRAFWLTGQVRYRDRCLAELASWLEANPPLVGVNWASMLELAFRSLSWIWAINFFVVDPADDPAGARSDEDASPWLIDLLLALDRQLRHVERNLSHYFSPNTHLLGEGLALYIAGCVLPELAASPRRAAVGRRILLQEISRQVSADGGHCERSTHYHRYVLDFYTLALVVARRAGDGAAAAAFADAVARLGHAARLLADDHGRLPHLGDDDGGTLMPMTARGPDDARGSLGVAAALLTRSDLQIEPRSEEVLWMLGPECPESGRSFIRAFVPSAALPDTGYYVSRSVAGDQLVIDAGPHGYQNGGHAHADALAITLAVRGVPLLIDPGAACYTIDPAMRDRMRSTALHNTLTLDGRSQSLPSGPFHWSHVARAQAQRWRTHDGFDYFEGTHDGYAPVEHRRRIVSMHGDLIVVADYVDGAGGHAAALHWHLDPEWRVETRARGAVFTRADGSGDRVGLSVPGGIVHGFSADETSGLGWCSPVYGRVVRTTTIRVAYDGAAPFWLVSVFDLDSENAVADVDWAPVWTEAGAVDHATAIRITRASSVDHVLFAEPATGRPRCRIGDVETDARMLMYRARAGRPLVCLASIDGTMARSAGRNLLIPDPVNSEPLAKASSCVALPVS